MTVCHNADLNEVLPLDQRALFVTVCTWWADEMESSPKLCVPTLLLFTYHTMDVLRGSAHVRAKIWEVVQSYVSVFAFFAFLTDVYQGSP